MAPPSMSVGFIVAKMLERAAANILMKKEEKANIFRGC